MDLTVNLEKDYVRVYGGQGEHNLFLDVYGDVWDETTPNEMPVLHGSTMYEALGMLMERMNEDA